MKQIIKCNRKEILFLMFSFLLMLIFSKSSPLYAFNDSGDINTYMIIGKGIKNDYMPYRDLFDHKGPVFLFLFGLINLISETSFIGVFIMEVIACYVSVHFMLEIFKVYNVDNLVYPLLSALLIYTARAFGYGGQTVEEFSMPIILYLMYVGVRYAVKNISISNKQYIIIGILGSLMLWSKYTILSFFIGWYIAIFILFIKRKQYKDILNSILYIGIGIIASSLMVILLLLFFGILKDCFNVYFLENIFNYGDSTSYITKLIDTNVYMSGYNVLLCLLLIITFGIALKSKNKNDKYIWLIPCLSIFLFPKPEVSLIYAIFPSLIIFIYLLISIVKNKKYIKNIGLCIIAICIAINVLNNNNLKDMNRPINDYPICELTKGINTDSLITLGLESGYYTLTDNLPKYKYFYTPLYSNAKQRNFERVDHTNTTPPKYCIFRVEEEIKTNELTYNNSKYVKIKEVKGMYNGSNLNYYLYELK